MLKTAFQDVGRLAEISKLVGRHGFDQVAEAIRTGDGAGTKVSAIDLVGAPKRFRLLLQDLGPTFVKFGQVLSTRPDLLPSAYVTELKTLQDKAAPLETAVIRKTIEDELGRPIEQLFTTFEDTSIAAASISQVHRATLPDGRKVVIKVQRPGIDKTIRSDLDLLYVLARVLEATIQEGSVYRPVAIVKEFERAIFEELDFLREVRNTREFQRNFSEMPSLRAPHVHEDLCTARVLCMEYVEGVKISELDRAKADIDAIVQTLLDGSFKMIYVDGYFHGDPHPGNIFVLPDNTVVLLDFGLVGRISKGIQDNLIQLSLAISMKDAENTARIVYRLGTPSDRVNLIQFRDEIQNLMGKYMSADLQDVDAGNLMTELFDLALRHKIRVQTDCAILVKASVTLEGIIRMLKPDLPVGATIAPYARKLLLSQVGIKAIGSTAAKSALGFLGSFRELPLQLDQIVSDLQNGRLTVRVSNDEIDKLSRSLNDMGSKVFLGLLACGLLLGTCFLLAPYKVEVKGVPVWPILGILGVIGLVTIVFWWHVLYGRIRKIRLGFWLGLFKKRKGE